MSGRSEAIAQREESSTLGRLPSLWQRPGKSQHKERKAEYTMQQPALTPQQEAINEVRRRYEHGSLT
ncbi:MAG TPA: hypothetical protein VFU69_02245, partial [Ktedonobacterales bacterium]|nr:hypothetical protein [Ktedonobacterales bacterium]